MLTGQINHYGGNVVDPTARELLAETKSQVQDLQNNAVILNGFFDDTLGWWPQVQGEDKREDTVVVHGREISHNTGNIEASPFTVTQTKVNYLDSTGSQFARMTNSYHELIVEGDTDVESESVSPNFSAVGATVYNKAKGGVGVCAVIGRVKDVGYSDAVINGKCASKSCAAAFMAYRHAPYHQGIDGNGNKRHVSYTIGIETYTVNEPVNPQSTDFYGNNDNFDYATWTCGYHCVNGGTHPVTAGIFISGFSGKASGMYNGIVIGASGMKINGTNSTETVGINMASWKKSGFYGHTAIKIGYAPRIVKSRGAALFETPGTKFLNPDGDMPFAISARNTPYIDFKKGSVDDYYQDSLPKERPTDVTHARIGYVSASDTMNFSCTGGLKFTANRQFTTVSDTSVEGESGTVQGNDTTNTV